ncbi:hypothetical protein BD289DRAFT_487300 [Coniella lustricola]|uniref:Uncharacterized protein n=1 Tax=Coniella lustricola TaxID=2025994 RepID=A0A2T2ZS89_9PEZI|nr:hypothetical protein BD289DRAFT_487300 [Coniella lustricola]
MPPSMHLLSCHAVKRPCFATPGPRPPRTLATLPAVWRAYSAASARDPALDDFYRLAVAAGPQKRPPRPRSRNYKPRDQRYGIKTPPTHLLVQQLQVRGSDLTSEYWEASQDVARSRNPRLPVLTHQYVLKDDQAMMMTSLYELLGRPEKWDGRLQRLAHKGLQEGDLAHWLWILEAESHDEQADRLLASDRFVPIFVLMAILRSDKYFRKGSSLVKLYDYIAQKYCHRYGDLMQARLFGGPLKPTMDDKRNMTPIQFMHMLRRLVYHCLQRFPSSIVMISRLVIDYIQTVTDEGLPKKSNRRTAYADRCMIFNHAIQLFRTAPESSPVAHSAHSWHAQKLLLQFSAELPQPLIISSASYRAIRMVLVGLKKSEAEHMTAVRHAKGWPPYIRRFDGVDESRDAEDFLSRSVKAGMLKRSEGYADDTIDRALDTIGGFVPGESVSIQHRSGPLRVWTSHLASLNVFTEWAAKVKATRSAQEAWQKFHEAPTPGLKPNFQVYAEMFSKLYAMETPEASPVVPGQGKETHPAHEAHLTEYERERLRPCDPDELYERMLRDGNRPVRHCLNLLIQHATSVEKAVQICKDGGLHSQGIIDLTTSFTPQRANLEEIPLPTFNAYLSLLCRLQSRRRWRAGQLHQLQPELLVHHDHLHRAVKLLTTRMTRQSKRAALPWHTVMQALAEPTIVLRPYVSRHEDNMHALQITKRLFEAYRATLHMHPVAFDCLARCVRKVLGSGDHHDEATLVARRQAVYTCMEPLQTAFWQLTKAHTVDAKDMASYTLVHELSSAHIQTYLETLMEYGDLAEGAEVVKWVLSTWGLGDVLQKARDPNHKQWEILMQAFACFRAYADASMDASLVYELQELFEAAAQQGGTWRWPTEEDVEAYKSHKEMQEDMARAFDLSFA